MAEDAAAQLKASPHRDAMRAAAGEGFAHYLRTDGSGARPIPPDLLADWIRRGWLDEVPPPEADPFEPVPAIVMDPFSGSGTTISVAVSHGRCGIGAELNPEYAAMSRKRIAAVPTGFF